jgi:hypothetical protein
VAFKVERPIAGNNPGMTVHEIHTRDTIEPNIPAAKIRILGLAPLKHKLGPKWDRLSNLVYKLFEKAITRVQGPRGNFILLNELSFAVTFHDFSLAETNLACIAIAREVCEMLFGEQVDEISIRTIVGEISSVSLTDLVQVGPSIEALLEKGGAETVVSQSAQSASVGPVVAMSGHAVGAALSAKDRIEAAHALLERLRHRLGLFPVWELQKGQSNSLFVAPFRGTGHSVVANGRRALDGLDDKQIAEIEIALLRAAAAYAMRVHDDRKVCAVGVGVSYGTLSAFGTRIAYITALQKVRAPSSSPIMLKIEQVPEGASLARVAELIAMLRADNIRATVEFQVLGAIPEIDISLGAIGFGGGVPPGTTYDAAVRMMDRLVHKTKQQKIFAFLERLDTKTLVDAAHRSRARFGTGVALGTRHFGGLEDIPRFPLAVADFA